MKTLTKILAVFFCFSLLGFAADAKGYGWFFKSNASHGQPEVLGGSSLPSQYGCLYLGDPDDKVVYLTFDAGYENGNVAKVLDTLKEHSAQAAFFILPNLVVRNTALVKRMTDEGHLVCNHSYSHKNMAEIGGYDAFLKEITGLEDVYREYTGLEMAKYFRPPEGSFSEQTLQYCREAGEIPVFWSFAYADWDNNRQPDPDKAYEKIMANVHNGMVMLLHPTSATNAAILSRVLTSLEEQGYRFGSLDELALCRSSADLTEYREKGMVYIANPSKAKQIALTFDDGPDPVQTAEILDILGSYGIKATFFVLGVNAEKYPGTLRRVIAEGHEIGNHTYSHVLISKSGEKAFLADAEKNREYLKAEFGVETTLLRPPGGCFTRQTVEKTAESGCTTVLWAWDTDARDWAGTAASSIVSTIEHNVRGGDIILLHDSIYRKSHTAEALRKVIPYLLEQGYEFVTVSSLFS